MHDNLRILTGSWNEGDELRAAKAFVNIFRVQLGQEVDCSIPNIAKSIESQWDLLSRDVAPYAVGLTALAPNHQLFLYSSPVPRQFRQGSETAAIKVSNYGFPVNTEHDGLGVWVATTHEYPYNEPTPGYFYTQRDQPKISLDIPMHMVVDDTKRMTWRWGTRQEILSPELSKLAAGTMWEYSKPATEDELNNPTLRHIETQHELYSVMAEDGYCSADEAHAQKWGKLRSLLIRKSGRRFDPKNCQGLIFHAQVAQ